MDDSKVTSQPQEDKGESPESVGSAKGLTPAEVSIAQGIAVLRALAESPLHSGNARDLERSAAETEKMLFAFTALRVERDALRKAIADITARCEKALDKQWSSESYDAGYLDFAREIENMVLTNLEKERDALRESLQEIIPMIQESIVSEYSIDGKDGSAWIKKAKTTLSQSKGGSK